MCVTIKKTQTYSIDIPFFKNPLDSYIVPIFEGNRTNFTSGNMDIRGQVLRVVYIESLVPCLYDVEDSFM